VSAETTKLTLEPGQTSPKYRRIIVDGIMGYVNSIGLKALVASNQEIYDEVLSSDPLASDKKRINRSAECQLIMSPTVAKSVHELKS
jgi:hypothetical protein